MGCFQFSDLNGLGFLWEMVYFGNREQKHSITCKVTRQSSGARAYVLINSVTLGLGAVLACPSDYRVVETEGLPV